MIKAKEDVAVAEPEKKLSEQLSAAPSEKEQNKAKLRRYVEEETKLVKGRFRNFETPGASVRVQIKKYKDVPMFDKWMHDNEMYEVPLYVARHLNGVDKTAEKIGGKINTCAHLVHQWKHGKNDPLPYSEMGTGPSGEPGIPVPILTSPKYRRRYGFESLEFDTN